MQARKTSELGRIKSGHVIPFLVLAVCLWILWPTVRALDFGLLLAQWRDISASQWMGAGLFTGFSFWAVGKYDVIAHRHFGTQVDTAVAHRSGMAAIALSQTLGMGLITGSLARWRLLPSLPPSRAAQITVFVTTLFLVAGGAIIGVIALITPIPDSVRLPAGLALITSVLVLAVALIRPQLGIGKRQMNLPGLPAIGGALVWAAVDLFEACMVLYMLLPADLRPDLWAFVPIFCIALGAGVLSGTPGGVGPFELVLLSLTTVTMPAAVPETSLIVALAGFRLVYYAVPAVLAGLYFAHGEQRTPRISPALTSLRDVSSAPRAETSVLRQTNGVIAELAHNRIGIWVTSQCLTGMFSPFTRPCPAFFAALRTAARNRNRFAVLYKCDAVTALIARKVGWQVLHMSDDAVVNLDTFDVHSPSRSNLRRKLRKAGKAGVKIRAMHPSDIPEMAKIDVAWQHHHGTARGGTMGRFCPDYLSHQIVYVAEIGGCIHAFASFHKCAQEWTLDIMRDGPNSPDGTMYALVHHALTDAQHSTAHRFCLAAVPACPDPSNRFWRWVAFKSAALSHSAGLRQFKSTFAPTWVPLYMASPTRFSLLIAALDIARAILFPGPVQRSGAAITNFPHDNDEKYEVDSSLAA